MPDSENTKSAPDYSWIFWLVLTCIAILIYGFTALAYTESNFLLLLSYCLPIALVSWTLYLVLFARRHGASVRIVSLAAIYTSLVISGFVADLQRTREAELALVEIRREYSPLFSSEGSATQSEPYPHGMDETLSRVRGKYGEITQFSRDVLADITALRNNYLLELAAIGWNSLLDADRVRADPTFVESRFIIRRAKEIVAKYANGTTVLLSNTGARIESLDFDDVTKAEMLESLELEITRSRHDSDEMWEVEARTVDEFAAIIDLLARDRSRWSIRNDRFLFESDADLATFRSHISRIKELGDRQHEIRVRRLSAADMAFEGVSRSEPQ